ncbi:DUF3817 domain-containing protein [Isoptericola sp. NEAU-Y5]|uniref:DUF3817 domain-containing protein n=1 Tax=Isoptericola luteus TaxID=2879484 RepID=A0ABS7ZHC6_9MICO|nr:DUF3817 domain-containing protein [Isoptericola sp. NEAU-Y5]MCA5894434.1 DUF3817 domain-containing protein [Isoptericola sp. NEAU-Y5]
MPAPVARPPLSGLGRTFAVVAVVEAFTWAGLLAGMFLKYVTETTEAGVWLFGRLHGAAFVAYVVVALVVAVRLRWGWFRTLVALAAAVPPLTTLLAERWLRRTGHLSAPTAAASAEHDGEHDGTAREDVPERVG